MRFLRPRLRAPAQMVALGAVLAVIFGLVQGLAAAVPIMVAFLALAALYYAWGGKDSDVGAVIGSRADERQKSVQMKVVALQGQVMSGAAALTFVVGVLGKTIWWPKANLWLFFIPLALVSLTGLVGWMIYRERGDRDDADGADADQARPRIEPQVPARPL